MERVKKWSVSFNDTILHGQAANKAEAAREAERAVDRVLGPKKIRLVRPEKQ
jgi:hypothetical protein